jgi:hypothetical protein
MTKKLQILRGTTAQNDAYTGSVGELTMDTEKVEVRIHDGTTQGGKIIGSSGGSMPDRYVESINGYTGNVFLGAHEIGTYTTDEIDAKIATVDAISSRVTALEGYDYVVAEQKPTASNNYTWYRKYKSGWVEQGGQVAVAKQAANTILSTDVSLPIIMSNAAYLVNATFITDGGNSTGLRLTQTGRNTTHITLFTFSTTNITNDYLMSWEIKGISA